MLRPLRTLLGLGFLVAGLWAAFCVDLGGQTFAEHIDTISDTPEAEQLLEGTRATVNPALQELRDRLLGEYVEAPTWIPDEAAAPEPEPAPEEIVPASTLGLEPGHEPPLPGRGPALGDAHEPPLPGRR